MLEFHIPFFSLRQGYGSQDSRRLRNQPFRKSRQLPLPCTNEGREDHDYFHEAQISFLLLGMDEWVWTAYCCVDTYFGSEPDHRTYHNGFSREDRQYQGRDAPTGGAKVLDFPIWNPREYFLTVLARRMMQATREWTNLVNTVQHTLDEYVSTFETNHRTSRVATGKIVNCRNRR